MCHPFDILSVLSGYSEGISKFLCSLSCLIPERPIELLKFLLSYSLLQGFRNCNVCAGQSFRCNLPSRFLGNLVYCVSHRDNLLLLDTYLCCIVLLFLYFLLVYFIFYLYIYIYFLSLISFD